MLCRRLISHHRPPCELLFSKACHFLSYGCLIPSLVKHSFLWILLHSFGLHARSLICACAHPLVAHAFISSSQTSVLSFINWLSVTGLRHWIGGALTCVLFYTTQITWLSRCSITRLFSCLVILAAVFFRWSLYSFPINGRIARIAYPSSSRITVVWFHERISPTPQGMQNSESGCNRL